MTGTWMERIAQNWLVLEITDSPILLGFTVVFQFSPVLLGGLWGGALADRFDARRTLVVLQACKAIPSLMVGALLVAGQIELWVIYLAAFMHGCLTVPDHPTRDIFVHDLVGREMLPNAVALNGAVVHLARLVGPTLAGGVIAVLGTASVFFLNAGSFVFVIGALLAIRVVEMQPRALSRRRAHVSDGLRYVRGDRRLLLTVILIAVSAVFVNNFSVTLALLASLVFDGTAALYGLLTAAVALGSLIGAVGVAARLAPSIRSISLSVTLLGASLAVLGLAPWPSLAGLALLPVGALSVTAATLSNAMLQLSSREDMRGRVMAIYSLVFFGMKPVGGAVAGGLAELLGVRRAFVLSATPVIAAGLFGLLWEAKNRPHEVGVRPDAESVIGEHSREGSAW